MYKESVSVPAGRVTLRMLVDMTTPAAVLLSATAPAMTGVLLSMEKMGHVSVLLAGMLLLIPSLMNASVDVLNDYFDYVNGNDTAENVVSESDGPLAWNRVENPKPALYFGIGLMIAAAPMGIYVIMTCGIWPALIGTAGGVIAVTYSGCKWATSHMPIGELLSGFTLGGLVPLGVYVALTGSCDWMVLFKTIPMMLIVSQFMLANNTCDIERDRDAGRRTLPIVIGRRRAEQLAGMINIVWVLQLFGVTTVWYIKGLPVLFVMAWVCRKGFKDTFRYARTHREKIPATAALAKVAAGVAVGYPLAIAVHLIISG